ncbi:MAG: hypothetical protein ACXVBZ_09035 [Flavisolibacter sp.]
MNDFYQLLFQPLIRPNFRLSQPAVGGVTGCKTVRPTTTIPRGMRPAIKKYGRSF